MQSTGRDPIEGDAALAILEGVDDLYVAKGKKSVHFDLRKGRPSNEELLGHLLGRSGKLRAPSVRTGTTLVVGYNAELMEETLL